MFSLDLTAPDSWGALSGSTWSAGVVTGRRPQFSKNTVSLYTGINMLTGLEGFSVGLALDYRMNGPNTFNEVTGSPRIVRRTGRMPWPVTSPLRPPKS
jgi:hypothetical protein